MKPSEYRDRVVDVTEKFAKSTGVMAPVPDDIANPCSERKEKEGHLLTQAEDEKERNLEIV